MEFFARAIFWSFQSSFFFIIFSKILNSAIEDYGITLNKDLQGLLGESGFLEIMYLVDISSRLDKEASKLLYGCRTMNWYTYPSPLCRCQLSSLDHIPCARYFYSKQLRKQACCDWWLGKLLEGKGEKYLGFFIYKKNTWWFFSRWFQNLWSCKSIFVFV